MKTSTIQRYLLLFALSLIVLIINVDYTAVNMLLITMSYDVHANLSTIQWVLSGYVLSWAALTLPAGKCADIYGHRRFCLLGLSLFLFASILASIANSAPLLILARILQGDAGALYVPTVYTMIHQNFPAEKRGLAIGFMSLGVGLGLAAGPMVGGLLLVYFSWRSVFIINIPIVLLAMFIIRKTARKEKIENQINTLNKTSATLLGMSVVSIIYVLSQWQHWLNHQILYPLMLFSGLALLVSFITQQKRIENPIMPPSLFANRLYVACLIGFFIEQFVFSSIIISSGFYLQKVFLYSTLKASIAYLPLTIIFGLIAAFGGRLVDKVGIKLPTIIGLSIMLVGTLFFSLLNPSSEHYQLAIIFLILGAGMGLAFTALNSALVKTVSSDQIGVASSIFALIALLGNTLGVIITTLIFERSSQMALVKEVKTLLPSISSGQFIQLKEYISHIGSNYNGLSLFKADIQSMIQKISTLALNHGVTNVMLNNTGILLLAILCFMKLMKLKTKSYEDISSAKIAS